MIYRETLNKLRSSNEPVEEAPVNKSFISRPIIAEPVQDDKDPLALVRQWHSVISQAGEQARKKAEIKRASEKPVIKEASIEEELPPLEMKEKRPAKSIFEGESYMRDKYGTEISGPPGPVGDLVSAIDRTEGAGRYDTLFGHSQNDRFQGVDISKMTIGQIKIFASPKGEYGKWVKDQIGRVATPMGRYQFVGTTLLDNAEKMGLSDDTVFSPKVQDDMFVFEVRKRLANKGSISEKVSSLRNSWEGLKNVPTTQLAAIVRKI